MPTAVATPQQTVWPTLPKWVSCPNPFYLFSTAFVLHSTGWNPDGRGLPAWLIPALVAGYIALMAASAVTIVRLWKVWDDARTILVMLFLLFLELALSLDQFAVARPQYGLPALLAGWLFSAGLTECLLRGLRMRLPGVYRGSLHLQLALMFAFPLVLIPGARASDNVLTTNLLACYAIAIAVPLLMLWPAVRRVPTMLENNGTPWRWPMYPWTIPVVMSACLLGRSFSLCLTYDGAPLLDASAAYQSWQCIWGGEFAAPMVFAAAILLLEAGLVTRRRGLELCGLALPVLAVMLCAIEGDVNPAREAFLERIAAAALAPTWLALLVCVPFYVVATLRAVRGAWRGIVLTAVGLFCIPSDALTLNEWTAPSPALWAAIGGGLLAVGFWRRRTAWCLEAFTYLVIAALVGRFFDLHPGVPALLAALHAWVAAMLVVAIVLDDELARSLRELGLAAMLFGAFGAVATSLKLPEPWWMIPTDLAAMTVLSALVWRTRRTPNSGTASLLLAGAAYATFYWQGAAELWRTLRWSGLPSFAIGLALLHVGILVSSFKGGVARRWFGAPHT